VETENSLWAFALAHAREPHFFDALVTPEAIDKAAAAWAASLPATRDEVVRACRYAARGFDDAEAAKNDLAESGNPVHRADASAAAHNLAELEKVLARAYAKLGLMPADVQCETPSRLERLVEAAAVELGKEMKPDEARLQADYDLTLREIVARLKAEKSAAEKVGNAAAHDGGDYSGGAVDGKVDPSPTGSAPVGGTNAAGKAEKKVIVVKHGNIIPQEGGDGNP